MKVHIWGARGSLPAPGPHTVRYGGNTACISVSIDERTTLVLDAGTGLTAMGLVAPAPPHTYYFLLSHAHWDHIQGLPLFAPLMCPGNQVIFLTEPNPDIGRQALSQFDSVHFPLCRDDIQADVRIEEGSINRMLARHGLHVSWQQMNHTGTCFGFRIRGPLQTMVYMTDNELGADNAVAGEPVAGEPGEGGEEIPYQTFRAFCQDAGVLIHDAQYLDEERDSRTGWGHSFLSDVCQLAQDAQVGHLILFHHDYRRTDDQVDALCEAAREQIGSTTECTAAYEGLSFEM